MTIEHKCLDCGKVLTSGFNKPKVPRCRLCHTRFYKDLNLRNKFGISLEQYEDLLIQQLGVCAICGKREDSKTSKQKHKLVRSLAVDHCHTSGKIRGLLCINCNTGLGSFKDNPDLLKKAITYLQEE